MSFYGTSYHYTAESFARVILKNAGLKNYSSSPTSTEFTVASEKDPVYLNAFQRDSGLGLQSGNYWITLAYDGTTVQIIHNKPDATTPQTAIVCFDKAHNAPIGAVSGDNKLKFGDILKVPVISYDAVGHIATTNESTYFQLPQDPAVELKARMQDIDGLPTEPAGKSSLKTVLTEQMDTISNKMDAMGDESDPNSLIYKLKEMETSFNKAMENFTTTEELVKKMEKDIYHGDQALGQTSILQRIFNLEN